MVIINETCFVIVVFGGEAEGVDVGIRTCLGRYLTERRILVRGNDIARIVNELTNVLVGICKIMVCDAISSVVNRKKIFAAPRVFPEKGVGIRSVKKLTLAESGFQDLKRNFFDVCQKIQKGF